jgi:hypothetical protein
MRVLIGLAALAAASTVNGQVVTTSGSSTGSWAPVPGLSQSALASFTITTTTGAAVAALGLVNGVSTPIGSGFINNGNWQINIANSISSVVFNVGTNTYTGQLQYRWSPNYPNPATAFPGNGLGATSYTCDICAGGTAITCNTSLGPGTSPSPANGFQCALLSRVYTFANIQASVNGQAQIANSFSVQLLDRQTNPGPNTISYSFIIYRGAPPIIGDPQIVGLQGQDFQVHGIPDEIFNMITYPNLQVNARFAYLSSAECVDNYTACFAHPGTYISEEGIRLGTDKVHVRAGAAKKGLSVSVNGQRVTSGKTALKLGSVEFVNHRRIVVSTPIMAIEITNSDKFLNQATTLYDRKLLALGAERRVLGVSESFHAEVPLHGLQGQTWRNVEYPSGLDYEGSISDYHVTDGNLFGSSFVFNQFSL